MHPYLKRKETEAAEAEGVKDVPLGIAFNLEVALTQARMAKRELSDAYGICDFGPQVSELIESSISRQLSVIEQLEEIDRKVKGK